MAPFLRVPQQSLDHSVRDNDVRPKKTAIRAICIGSLEKRLLADVLVSNRIGAAGCGRLWPAGYFDEDWGHVFTQLRKNGQVDNRLPIVERGSNQEPMAIGGSQ